MNQLPKLLYHGSGFKHQFLSPGYVHTKVKIFWDETESNEYLYATTDKDVALENGFASIISTKYEVNHYQTVDNVIRILFNKDYKITEEQLKQLDLYLYTIVPNEHDEWNKNNNQHNGLTTEWKTNMSGIRYKSIEKINLKDWLKDKTIEMSVESITPKIFKGW